MNQTENQIYEFKAVPIYERYYNEDTLQSI